MNTFSTGNRKRRPKNGRRYNKKKTVARRCHDLGMGLLITPGGHRIPFHCCYYTKMLTRRGLSDEARQLWIQQRPHGLCEAVREEAERNGLTKMANWSDTKTGLEKQVRTVRPSEYRVAN